MLLRQEGPFFFDENVARPDAKRTSDCAKWSCRSASSPTRLELGSGDLPLGEVEGSLNSGLLQPPAPPGTVLELRRLIELNGGLP